MLRIAIRALEAAIPISLIAKIELHTAGRSLLCLGHGGGVKMFGHLVSLQGKRAAENDKLHVQATWIFAGEMRLLVVPRQSEVVQEPLLGYASFVAHVAHLMMVSHVDNQFIRPKYCGAAKIAAHMRPDLFVTLISFLKMLVQSYFGVVQLLLRVEHLAVA
jgi:hypothetical protein